MNDTKAKRRTFVDDPKNHGKPLWVVYGTSRDWPGLMCCKLLAYTSDHVLLPAGTAGPNVAIWGYSVYRGEPGFRTLGMDVHKWCAHSKFGPYFYDKQSDALSKLTAITTPRCT